VTAGGRTVLVTGGAGYFGTVVVDQLVARGDRVRVFDLNEIAPRSDGVDVEMIVGDIRDRDAVRSACEGVDAVVHSVAQVPLARDRHLFRSVNVGGTAELLVAARRAGVGKVVALSSSAIFGIPESNPVTEDTPPAPLESYGQAKAEAEELCREAAATGLDVTVIRPRTILGHGRLGIFGILFEFVAEGAPVYVLDGGTNRYQFVHADDLADACLRALDRPGARTYNIGTKDFGTMRDTLEALVAHAATGSRVRSLPSAPARLAMKALSTVGATPFAPYHWLLYGESLWFDTSRAEDELGWRSTRSNAEMVVESYEWFLAHRHQLEGGSAHQSPAKLGALAVLKRLP
jgi:nucleoside-diphosphate-sugar epimerase